jgi:hypothetical protein
VTSPKDMKTSKKQSKNTYALEGAWAGAWKISAAIGVVGAVAAFVGMGMDARRFAFSWLFAFCTVLSIALGATFFVLIQRLTSAGWSVTVRRTAEFFSHGLIVMVLLFIPVLMQMGHLFPWLGHHGDDHGEHHSGDNSSFTLLREAHAQPVEPTGAEPPATVPAEQPSEPRRAPGGGTGAAGAPTTPAEGPQGPDKSPNPVLGGGDHGVPAEGPDVHDPAGLLPGAKAQLPPDMPQPDRGVASEPHAIGDRAAADHAAHARIHASVLAKKSKYLNQTFFLVRAAFYFLVWIFLATRLFGYSADQDRSRDPKLTLRAQRFSAPGAMLFALTLTFAAFDWIMSLEPTWFSTIFGVYYFATGVVSSLAVIILVTMSLRSSGPLRDVVTVEHYHDLGKLMFGFLVFWAYIGFSQFMLIWYASLPEETTWYHNRWDFAPWSTVSTVIVIGHFVVPFFWLISRNAKRNLGLLQIGAAILLIMHVVDMYWFVMPNYLLGQEGFTFHWLDIACLLAVGGIYGAWVFFRMTKFPLIPIGDPRLARSLHFQNA